tara:strand:- start:23097 stop:23468 length:372 start_codon:yes stop_codon:yes gene_type:complete
MSYDINIVGIKTSGKHGIYEVEKSSDQKFLVDVKISLDNFQGDDIHDTINYENVVDDVIRIVKIESFNLIETLSKKITQEIYKKYDYESNVKIFEIIVTVHKPDTILKEKTNNLSVTYSEKFK